MIIATILSAGKKQKYGALLTQRKEGKDKRGQGLAVVSVNLTSWVGSPPARHAGFLEITRITWSEEDLGIFLDNTCMFEPNVAPAVSRQLDSKEKTNLCAIYFLVQAPFVGA